MEKIYAWLQGFWGLGEISSREAQLPGAGKLTLLGMGKAKEARDVLGGGESRYVWKFSLNMLISPPQKVPFESFLTALGQGDFPYPEESFDRAFQVSNVSQEQKTGGNTLYHLTFTATYNI